MNEKTMIECINKLHQVTTKPLNMFNLHELYVDNIMVGYVRMIDDWIQLIACFEYSYRACDIGKVSLDKLNDMVEKFRSFKMFYI